MSLPDLGHRTDYRIYYEDTDAAGMVYYANYLKFAERARTEWLRSLGFEQSLLLKDEGIGFVVHHCEIDFLKPAKLDDLITLETRLQELGKVRMTMQQVVKRGDTILAELSVGLACVDRNSKPVRWPQALISALEK